MEVAGKTLWKPILAILGSQLDELGIKEVDYFAIRSDPREPCPNIFTRKKP
ncbi:MAG: hypothetical protein QXK93_06130 [Candidatus Bathyarchaeia archaeon]